MALKGLKLIQNGNITYVPYNTAVIKYWQEWNQRVQKSRDAEKHLVTIDNASPDEVEKYLFPSKTTKSQPVIPSLSEENKRLREENEKIRNEFSDLKSMMLRFMADRKLTAKDEELKISDDEDEFADITETVFTKKKAGRPPKNQ